MKQVLLQKGEIIVDDVPPPVISGNGILVRTCHSVISSGTELAALLRARETRWERLRRMIPEDGMVSYLKRKIRSGTLIKSSQSVMTSLQTDAGTTGGTALGYSSSGVVIGKDSRIDSVALNDAVTCGGTRHAGVNYVPRNLFAKLPQGVDLKDAAFATLGCIAMQGVRRARVRVGDIVVVIGQGIIGQLTARLVSAAGAYPIVTDFLQWRLDIAKNAGAYQAVNAAAQNAVHTILGLTAGRGADAVIVCASSTSSKPLRDAIAMSRDKGRIVLVGDVKIDFPRGMFYEKELDFLISRSYGPGRYDPLYEEKGLDYPYDQVPWTEQRNMQEFIRLLSTGAVSVRDLISCEFDIARAADAYERMLSNPDQTMAVLLNYDGDTKKDTGGNSVMLNPFSQPDRQGTIRTAVIGCGNFAAKYHLPTLNGIKEYSVAAVVDVVGTKAKQMARRYGARLCSADYRDAINDPAVDLVVITTRHNLHVPIAIDAMKAGKHVLVEKPMAMNPSELKSLISVVSSSPQTFMIGFNRRFSPLTKEAKTLLGGRTSPVVIHYRVANTFAPATSWVHDPQEGGGTIIGECCHFFDLLYWLVGHEPVRIFAEGGTLTHPGKDIYDNTVISIKFQDGSIATITFTDMGNENFPKERIEIFSGDRTIVIDDFRKMSVCGESNREIALKTQAKGHYEEFLALRDSIRDKKPSPVSYRDGTRAMVCCFKTLDSLRQSVPQSIDISDYLPA